MCGDHNFDEHFQTKIKLAVLLSAIRDGSLQAYRDSLAKYPCINVASRDAVLAMLDKFLAARPEMDAVVKIADRETEELRNAPNN